MRSINYRDFFRFHICRKPSGSPTVCSPLQKMISLLIPFLPEQHFIMQYHVYVMIKGQLHIKTNTMIQILDKGTEISLISAA